MARAQTLVQLTEELVAALDQRAARLGTSRSAIIRAAIRSHLADDLESEISRRIIEGYARIPQATSDEWGDPQAFGRALAGDAHRRLDAEERAAGREPW